jgi:hypothetical protein
MYIQYLKSEKNKDIYGIHPTKFASTILNHKKIIETPNQPIEIKQFSNKSMFKSEKKPKIRMGAT